ncbi:MAG: flagellar filament capping protein FliD [Oligoflexales bacterium]
MPIRMHTGLKQAGINPSMIDELKKVQRIPLESAKKRKSEVQAEKTEFEDLNAIIGQLDSSLNKLKTRYDFYKLKLDSSHPDIIDGSVAAGAMLGNYEVEVRAMARSEKELAYGFPDKDDTPVGFGYMLIERDDGKEIEVMVEPYTTLQEVAEQINESEAGVRAMVINTKYKPEPYRLLVVSEQSGREASIYLDEDTTFLEFKEQVTGRNLDVLFEDVPVTDEDNVLDELIDGVTLNVRRSEPGTRIQVSVVHDIDATIEGINEFVTAYNDIAMFVHNQFQENPDTGGYGRLAGDSSIKMIMRQLQDGIQRFPISGEKFGTLSEVGITTNPKTGELTMDEAKVRNALTEDYDSVANLFIRSKSRTGLAEVLSSRIRALRDPGFGVLKSRIRGLDQVIRQQDETIERRTRQIEAKEEAIDRQFTVLEGTLANLKGQSDFLSARLGGAQKKG